jgi:hypothetical protein
VDCSTAVNFYSLNEQIAAERAENSPPGTAGGQNKGRPASGAAKNGQTGAAAALGGYARYCEDFFYEKYNSNSIHYHIKLLKVLIRIAYTSFRYTVFKDRRDIMISGKS